MSVVRSFGYSLCAAPKIVYAFYVNVNVFVRASNPLPPPPPSHLFTGWPYICSNLFNAEIARAKYSHTLIMCFCLSIHALLYHAMPCLALPCLNLLVCLEALVFMEKILSVCIYQ